MSLLSYIICSIIFITLLSVFVLVILIRLRNMQYWLGAYIKNIFSGKATVQTKHLYFCFVDHYEPYYGDADEKQARALVDTWVKSYPEVGDLHHDSNGKTPQHSYFYPIEEYDEYIIDELAKLCSNGYGDVEVHLHHDDDTADNLTKELTDFKQLLYDRHQLLRKNEAGEIVYGFIHGNWALDNSRPDGRWCGVDNEIDVLINTGCVYDMTLPSAPSDTQTKTINSIYYATDNGCAKSHDQGRALIAGKTRQEDNELLMIQGPLALNWKNRKLGLIPKIESGELSGDCPPSEQRTRLWQACKVCIEGAEEHVFIKVHTHGLQQSNMDMLFGEGGFEDLWHSLESLYRDVNGCKLHYLTAWEMYEKIKQLEA